MQTYETKGGVPSRADTYAKLIDLIRQCEEQSYTLGHLYKMDDDELIGQGFLAIGEMFKLTGIKVTQLATGKLRREGGFR